MSKRISKRNAAVLIVMSAALTHAQLSAQPPARGGAPQAPKVAAPIDLTGYWVSVVTEDWRYRMVVPAPGDYQGVPMTAEAVKVADAWDPAKDEEAGDQCKSFGAPALLRVPEHLHITWNDDNTLRMDIDAGTQTRLFHFGRAESSPTEASLQGESIAQWEFQRANGRTVNGSLRVATSHLRAGYLRKNGVPYSENATLTEYFDLVHERSGDQLMVVTIVVTDPKYLREDFIISSHFKKQADDTGWKPSACSSRW